MLTFIAGRAGTGKTYEALTQAVKEAELYKATYIIVPEQSTLSYERQLINYNRDAYRLGVEVLSFTRMVEKVMLETGGLAGNYIDSMGKTALMFRAIRNCADELKLFGKYAGDPRFAVRIAETADELKTNGVSPDALKTASEAEGVADTLRGKLGDTALIVREYERLIKGSFFDPADRLTALGEILDCCDFFDGCAVYFDGFTGFTPQEEKVIGQIIRGSEKCVISLTAPSDRLGGGSDEFYPVLKMADHFRNFALENGVDVGEATILDEDHKFCTDTMKLLESKLFSDETGLKGGEDVAVYSAADPYDEMRFVASEIRRLTLEGGCRYRDIAVIAGDLEACRSAAEIEFEQYGIPYFIDSRRDVRFKPLMRLVIFAFRAALRGMRFEDMADLAKTGLAGTDVEQTALLENYVNLWRVSGRKWEKEFTLNPSGFTEHMTERDTETLAAVNEARKKLAEPLCAFASDVKAAKTADDFAEAIYSYLEAVGAADTIRAERAAALAAGEEYDGDRMWELLMDVLDRVSSAMAGDGISAEQYSELIHIMFENADVGVIPPHTDEVIIGSEGRARVEHIKYCFIVGASEDCFPRPFGQKGVFTNADKEEMFGLDVRLMHDEETRRCELMLSVYNALTIPSHGLCISYSASENPLSASSPSRVIGELKTTFNDCRVLDASLLKYEDLCSAPAAALEVGAGFFAAPADAEQAAVCAAIEKTPGLKEKLSVYRTLCENSELPLDPSAASAVAATTRKMSAAKAEAYSDCAYKYFCKYGLSLHPEAKAELDSLSMGTFIHYVLEKTVKAVYEDGIGDVPAFAAAAARQYVDDCLGGADNLPPSLLKTVMRTTELVVELVDNIRAELSETGYSPRDYEIKIGDDGIAPWKIDADGGCVGFEGKIDRVDVCERGGKKYVRVIDYKSGGSKKEFSLSSIYAGSNIQMLVYLIAIWLNGASRYGEDVCPAGVYYFPAHRWTVDEGKNYEEEKAKNTALSGIALKDSPVDGRVPEKLRPPFYTMEQLRLLRKHIEKLMRVMRGRLAAGEIPKLPLASACKYCDYAAVCGVDERDVAVRETEKLKAENVFERLREEYGDE